MVEFYIKNIIEWKKLIFEQSRLKLSITKEKHDFFSHITVEQAQNLSGVVFFEAKSTPYKISYFCDENVNIRESFLLVYSQNHFVCEQKGNVFDLKRKTFLLNLNYDFNIKCIGNSEVKFCIIPFYLISEKAIKSMESNSFYYHPLYDSIDLILRSIKFSDNNSENKIKINAIVYSLSLSDLLGKADSMENIKNYIKREIKFGNKINLDVLCSEFNMSRRKMQYIFSENKTTYLNVMKEIKLSNNV